MITFRLSGITIAGLMAALSILFGVFVCQDIQIAGFGLLGAATFGGFFYFKTSKK